MTSKPQTTRTAIKAIVNRENSYSNVTFVSIGTICMYVFPSFTSISFPFSSLYIVCAFLDDFEHVIFIAFPFVI